MSEFFTLDFLLTFAGCGLGAAILTQFVKKLSFLQKIDTQVISAFFAILILQLGMIATTGFTWVTFGMNFLNGILIGLTSNGAYDAVMKMVQGTQDELHNRGVSDDEA